MLVVSWRGSGNGRTRGVDALGSRCCCRCGVVGWCRFGGGHCWCFPERRGARRWRVEGEGETNVEEREQGARGTSTPIKRAGRGRTSLHHVTTAHSAAQFYCS